MSSARVFGPLFDSTQVVLTKKSSALSARRVSYQIIVPPGLDGVCQNMAISSTNLREVASPGADQIRASLSLQSADGSEGHTACRSPSLSLSGAESTGHCGSLQLSLIPSQISGAPGYSAGRASSQSPWHSVKLSPSSST